MPFLLVHAGAAGEDWVAIPELSLHQEMKVSNNLKNPRSR